MRQQLNLIVLGITALLMGLPGPVALADRPGSAGRSQRLSSPDAPRQQRSESRYHSPAPERRYRDPVSNRQELRREISQLRQQRAADNASDRIDAMQRRAELRLRQREEIARRRAQDRLAPRTYRYHRDYFDRYDSRYRYDGRHSRLNDRYRTWYWGTIPPYRPYSPHYRAPYRPLDLSYGGRRYRVDDTWYYTPPYVLHPRYYRHDRLWDHRYRYPLYQRQGYRYRSSPRFGFYIDLRF